MSKKSSNFARKKRSQIADIELMINLHEIIKKVRVKLYDCLSTNKPSYIGVRVQPVLFLGKGKIEVGEKTIFGFFPSPFFYSTYCHLEARHEDSKIIIGNNNHFNNNFSIVADHGDVIIGDMCLVGTNVSIINSDFHPIRICDRHTENYTCKNVVIGNNVFIGNDVVILKGVSIGDNAVIANRAVVFDNVEANTIVRGNPAKFYKQIYE